MITLQGTNVAITRPLAQAQGLAQRIRRLAGNALLLPMLDIIPCLDSPSLANLAETLASLQLAIFTSSNAIKYTVAALQQRHLSWPTSLPCLAVGAATANAIAKAPLSQQILYPEDFNSEALLALPELQAVQQQTIAIFTGEQSRPLLTTELQQRGAQVIIYTVYRRAVPPRAQAMLQQHWQANDIHIIVSTSNESLHHLYHLTESQQRSWLAALPLVVTSQGMAEYAQQLSLGKPLLVAANASDDAIMTVLLRWKENSYAN